MYIPKYFRNNDPASIKAFIAANSFGLLINTVDNKPWATHIPMMFYTYPSGEEVLSGHISRGNKQWKSFEANPDVLAIFGGDHTYISSSWYDHENVPTWNYLAVHIHGKIRIVEGDKLVDHLAKMVDKYEQHEKNPISVSAMSDPFLKNELKGIVGFEIEITEINAVSKLSQNRDDKNYEAIITNLNEREDQASKSIAKHMRDLRK